MVGTEHHNHVTPQTLHLLEELLHNELIRPTLHQFSPSQPKRRYCCPAEEFANNSTCFLQWLSTWCAEQWFQALCSAGQHPERPTWQRMEKTHLCLPLPSYRLSHGRLFPWQEMHPSDNMQPSHLNQTSLKAPSLTCQTGQWHGQRYRWRRRRCDTHQTRSLLQPPEDPGW